MDKISERKKYKVSVTFLEEIVPADFELRDFCSQTQGLEFWEDPREDIYQDYLPIKHENNEIPRIKINMISRF